MKTTFIQSTSVLLLNSVIVYVAGQPSSSGQYCGSYINAPAVYKQVIWYLIGTRSNQSSIQCAVRCMNNKERCKAFASTRPDGSCVLLSDVSKVSADVWVDENSECRIPVGTPSVEFPVFRVSAGGKVDVGNAWLQGISQQLSAIDTPQLLDLGVPLLDGNYFRHPLLDNWERGNIQQVTVALFANKERVVELQFTVSGSSLTSWFSLDNLSSSPFSDIYDHEVNKFGIFVPEFESRQFYINSIWANCPHDIGWMAVVSKFDDCEYWKSTSYPMLLYVTEKRQNWGQGDIRNADDLLISVRIVT